MAEGEAKERKILVAVDEGEESMYALSWCLNNVVSQNYKDTFVLLYAKQPRPFHRAVDRSGYLLSSDIMETMERYSNQVADCVMKKAKRLCKDIRHAIVKMDARVEIGDAREVICQTAERLGVDMVVLGSHDYGLLQRAFLGSVSNHCAHNAKCPVLIVKRPKSTASTK